MQNETNFPEKNVKIFIFSLLSAGICLILQIMIVVIVCDYQTTTYNPSVEHSYAKIRLNMLGIADCGRIKPSCLSDNGPIPC
jgi:amino acid transporter